MRRFLSAFISIAFLYSLLAPPILYAQSDRVFLAVLDLDVSSGIPDYAKISLSDLLREQLWKTGRFRVVDRNNMERIMKEQGFQLADCTSKECAVQVGRLLGVQKMVTGNISKLGRTYILSVQITDVETGEIVRMASDRCPGCELDELLASIDKVSREMAGVAEGEVAPPKITGGIQVHSIPPGATVTLNGKPVGKTPALVEQLRPGMYQVEVEKDRYLIFQKKVEVKDTLVEVEAKLTLDPTKIAPAMGSLDITTEPDGARVFLDGEAVGATPILLEDIDPGVHKLSFTKWGYIPAEMAIKVGTEQMPVRAVLKKLAAVKIAGKPSGARISLDGSFLGASPRETTLSPGTHTIEISKPGYVTYRDEFKVSAEEKKTVEYKLATAEVEITEEPAEPKPPKEKKGRAAKALYYTGLGLGLWGLLAGFACSEEVNINDEYSEETPANTMMITSFAVGGVGTATAILSYILMPAQTGRQRAHLFGFSGIEIALVGGALAGLSSWRAHSERDYYDSLGQNEQEEINRSREYVEAWNQMVYVSYGIMGAGAVMALISFLVAPAQEKAVAEIPLGKGFSVAPELVVVPGGGYLGARAEF